MAAWHGREGVVRLLLDKGADVLSKSDVGYTPEDVTSHPAIKTLLKAVTAHRARSPSFSSLLLSSLELSDTQVYVP